MQFPESWLREFCNPPLTTQQLADTLTMGGLEVEELRPVAPPFSRIVVGEIREAVQHPDADRLRVCQVDAGQGALLNIVCGAPNARAGIKVPCALVGAQLPAGRRRQALPDQARQAARRRKPGHAVLGARTPAQRRPRRPARAAAGCRRGRGRARRAEAGRHAVHAQADAESGPCPERVRCRPRAFGAHRRAAQAAGIPAWFNRRTTPG